MSLRLLLDKKELVVMGINSGTSADGADLAVLKFSKDPNNPVIKFLAGGRRAYPDQLRELIAKVSRESIVSVRELVYLDNVLGLFFGRAARSVIKRLAKRKVKIDLIASHGQTIRHLPEAVRYAGEKVRGTRQIGSLEQIAALTGKVTVGDFRQADIALGREGAPITIAAMAKLFGSPRESRLLVNIGGIANYFYFPKGSSIDECEGADCGPGNSLVDLLAEELYREKFDAKGKKARKGKISQQLRSILLSHPFFREKIKSTGREIFGRGMVDEILEFGRQNDLSNEDLMATAGALTVKSIAGKVKPLLKRDKLLTKLYLTGGGEKNTFFKKGLREEFPELQIKSIAELGIQPGLVEASAYAVMGHAALKGLALPTVFGKTAKKKLQPVSGKIVQPPRQ